MTCREKLMTDHPEWDRTLTEDYINENCPDNIYDIAVPDKCDPDNADVCRRCWDREIPESTITSTEGEEIVVVMEKVPVIKDSGNRREFSSGAVRDMQEGKGRCDLMPLEVVANYFRSGIYPPDPKRSEDYYMILNNIANFKNGDYTRTEWLYIAMDVFIARRYDYTPTAFLEVAKHFEEGAKKYSEDNWKKGIPPKCYIDSAVRHFLKWVRGDDDEPHDRAFLWNLMCCIWEVDYHSTTVEAVNE